MPKPTASDELALLKYLAEQHLKGLQGSYQFWEIMYENQANQVRSGTTLSKNALEVYDQANKAMAEIRPKIELAEAALKRVSS